MKLFFYLMSLMTIVMTVFGVQALEKDTFLVIRSIQTHYQVTDGASFSVSVYASQISDLLLATDIDRTRFISDDLTFDVGFEDMSQDHQETYLNRTYFEYEIKLNLPTLYQDIYLKDVYLEITTLTHTHLILIGHLTITPYMSSHAHDWGSIYGIRQEKTMTLDKIIIETSEDLHVFISEGISYQVIKHDTYIEIQIHTKDTIITHPILVIQSVHGTEMIAGMNFISSKRMLTQTEGFHYVYAVY
jgi:hypothetical protein